MLRKLSTRQPHMVVALGVMRSGRGNPFDTRVRGAAWCECCHSFIADHQKRAAPDGLKHAAYSVYRSKGAGTGRSQRDKIKWQSNRTKPTAIQKYKSKGRSKRGLLGQLPITLSACRCRVGSLSQTVVGLLWPNNLLDLR